MDINLQKDYKKVYDYIQTRIENYTSFPNQGPGENSNPVTQITIGYQFDQAGWCALVIDTRAGAEPDGEWNSYIQENLLEMNHWFEACDDLWENEKGFGLTLIDGTKVNYKSEDDLEGIEDIFGELLKKVLVDCRNNKVLSKLPLANQCIMGVEESGGMYGWPNYDDRLTEGLVNK
jgi:hypothetical protein